MNEIAPQTKNQPQANPLLASGVLQRKCACGSHTVAGGNCRECQNKEHSLQPDVSGMRQLNAPKLQKKLAIGAVNDPLEEEADRIAEQVLSMPEAGSISNASPRIQRFTGAWAEQTDVAPASVDRVLSSPGKPLEPTLRHDMEQRFSYDFSRVRVHSDAAAAASAKDVSANAYTAGHNIVFGIRQFEPGTNEGRRLIAHELTHVVQQQCAEKRNFSFTQVHEQNTAVQHNPSSSKLSQEQQADQNANGVFNAPSKVIIAVATHGLPQYQRGSRDSSSFIYGDIRVNPRARQDIRERGNLLPGPDQPHLALRGDRLGYRSTHTNPDDPFRWQRLKEIVDRGQAKIYGVGSATTFPVKEINDPQPARVVQRSLLGLMANGITLLRESQHRSIEPGSTQFIASTDDSKDEIYYASDISGRGLLFGNALAHEFYGHLWLSMQGVSWRHGTQLTTGDRIQDPYGQSYVGSVDSYIERFAAATGSALQSPTQRVSTQHFRDVLRWFQQHGASQLTGGWGGDIEVGSEFGLQWEVLVNNYYVLGDRDRQSAVAAEIRNWFTRLNSDQQYVFLRFVDPVAREAERRALQEAVWAILPQELLERYRSEHIRSTHQLAE